MTDRQIIALEMESDAKGYLGHSGVELLIEEIRTLQQQNRQLIDAMENMLSIDPHKFTFYEYLYYACTVQDEVMKSIQGG